MRQGIACSAVAEASVNVWCDLSLKTFEREKSRLLV
jgi:hypothetical protein